MKYLLIMKYLLMMATFASYILIWVTLTTPTNGANAQHEDSRAQPNIVVEFLDLKSGRHFCYKIGDENRK